MSEGDILAEQMRACQEMDGCFDDRSSGYFPSPDRRKQHIETCLFCKQAIAEARATIESFREKP